MHKAAQPVVLVGLHITKGHPTGFPGVASLGLELYLSAASSPHMGSIHHMPQCRHYLHHLEHFQVVLEWLQCSLQKYTLPKKVLGDHEVPDRPKQLVELCAPVC